MAAPQITPGSSPAASVPKKLLTKSKRALSEADLHQASADRPVTPSKSQTGVTSGSDTTEHNTQSPPPKSSIGTFHHLPHYMKLYEIIKGAFANNQVKYVLKYLSAHASCPFGLSSVRELRALQTASKVPFEQTM